MAAGQHRVDRRAGALLALEGVSNVTVMTTGERETFAEQGYLVVRQRIPQPCIDAMIGVVTSLVDRDAHRLLERGVIRDACDGDPFTRRWYRIWRQHGGQQEFSGAGWHSRVFSRALYELWVEPAILDAVEALIGPEIQFNGDFWVRPKLPAEQETTLPWHQDSGYMPGTAEQKLLTVWLPLVDVNADNGTLQFIPGSHELGIHDHGTQSGRYRTTAFDPADGAAVDTVPMQPGDFVIFHNLVFHRSTLNRADTVRWSVDFRYSPVGTSMDHLWHADMAFVARSRRAPGAAATWGQVQAAWAQSDQRTAKT